MLDNLPQLIESFVGQKVRVVNPGGWLHGKIGTVLSVCGDVAHTKFHGKITAGYPVDQLETVESKQPKRNVRQSCLPFAN